MFDSLLLLNKLGSVDAGFFVACAVIIVLIVAIYFLIPVFNKKQYQEQRDNLKKREEAFRSTKNATVMTNDRLSATEDAFSGLERKDENAVENNESPQSVGEHEQNADSDGAHKQ